MKAPWHQRLLFVSFPEEIETMQAGEMAQSNSQTLPQTPKQQLLQTEVSKGH
jgi:hypothetical protein